MGHEQQFRIKSSLKKRSKTASHNKLRSAQKQKLIESRQISVEQNKKLSRFGQAEV